MKKIRIGFDAKRAAQNLTGLGNYSRFIIHSVSTSKRAERLYLFTPNPKKLYALRDTNTLINTEMVYPTAWWAKRLRMAWRLWGQIGQIDKLGLDIFHGLSNELPLNIKKAKCKSVVTIHDLIFLHFPQYYKPIDRKIYTYKFRKACENADRIIAVSECTKRDIMRFFHTAEDKIDVVYQGCHPQFREGVAEEEKERIRKEYELPKRYILYLGSIEERKNLLLLAKAMQHLPQDYEVVAIGKRTPYTDKIAQYLRDEDLIERVHLLSNVPFTCLPAIYQMAEVFVYPSRYEGFGIPMLEALCSGTPAIGATGSCLEEAGGPDSLYTDPDNPKELAEMIQKVYTDATLRETMIKKGKDYAQRFTEDKLTEDLLKVYEKVLS